jgi:ribosomal protein L19E
MEGFQGGYEKIRFTIRMGEGVTLLRTRKPVRTLIKWGFLKRRPVRSPVNPGKAAVRGRERRIRFRSELRRGWGRTATGQDGGGWPLG